MPTRVCASSQVDLGNYQGRRAERAFGGQGLGFRVQGSGFRVQGLGFRV